MTGSSTCGKERDCVKCMHMYACMTLVVSWTDLVRVEFMLAQNPTAERPF